jgi:hypothetical protein
MIQLNSVKLANLLKLVVKGGQISVKLASDLFVFV